MKIYAPRWYRLSIAAGTVAALLLLGEVFLGLAGYLATRPSWVDLLVCPVLGLYFGLQFYLACFRPLVRIDDRAIEWRSPVAWRFEQVGLEQVTDLRIQDSYDLRLRLGSGDERAVHLGQVARPDRDRLIERLRLIGL
jgi:hypothetical protein